MHRQLGGAYQAALYIRLSKEDEKEGPSESVSNQQSLLEAFVRQHQLSVYGTYIDDGWSGTNFDRPAFQQMIRDIEAKRVNLVITKDLSRLGRDYILTGHYMERYFPEHGVRYISLLDGIDTGVESTANDITPFRAIMNDMYAKDISKKIKSVKRDKQRRGLFIGGKPVYGYQMHPTEKNRIVIDEGAAPTVRRIFTMALSGMSCRQIAAQLNREGIPSPAAYAGLTVSRPGPHTGQWSGERISEMLQNETYIGHMVQGRRVKISYKSRKCQHQPKENWVVVTGTHPPLISQETFDQVGKLVSSRKHTRQRTYDFLLKGLIFCHECGCPLGVVNRKNAKGEDVLYFLCGTYRQFTQARRCTSHCIQVQRVTGAVIDTLSGICRPWLQPEWLLPAATAAAKNAACSPGVQPGKIQRLTAHLEQLYMDRLNGLLAEGDFQRIYQRVSREREALETRQRFWQQSCNTSAGERAKALVQQFLDGALANRQLLCSLIQRVELTENKTVLLFLRCRQPTAEDGLTVSIPPENGGSPAGLP